MVEENPIIIKSDPVDRAENPSKKIVINFSCLEPRLSSGNLNQLSPNKRAFSQIKCQVPPSKKPKKTESFEKEPKKCSILFKCPKCDFSSNSAVSLTQHIKTSHRKFIDNSIIMKKEQVLLAKSQEKSEPVIFENPLISQTSIWIKEELNEINNVQNDNSDFNNFVEVSEPNYEDCQNSFEDSEVEDPVNYIGLIEPKIENCDSNSLENFELEELNLPSNEDHNLTIKEEFSETPVKPKELSETSTKSKKSSCRSQTTKFKQLGFVFGSQITEFDKDVLPTKSDVISVWISKFDQARGEKIVKFSQDLKHVVLEDIVQSLIFVWQSQNIQILSAQRIKDEVVKLIKQTEYIRKNYNSKISDKIWIEEQRELFSNIFNIGKISKMKQPIDLGEPNLPSSEDNLKIKEEFPEIFVKSEEFSETSIKSEIFIDASESYNELPSDISVKNEDPLSTNSVHEGKNVFQCKFCNSGFKYKKCLFEHINMVHEENKPFKCNVCWVGFAIEDTLKRHILVVHEEEKTFECRECDSTFIDRSNWRTHFTLVHEGKKPHKCPNCESSFLSKWHVGRHIEEVHEGKKRQVDNVHEGNKRFTCFKCGQKFNKKDNLRYHTETVHEGKKFECEKCDSSFVWKQSLKKHVDKCHPNEKEPNLNGQS
jgi:rubrerythrin